MPRRSSLFVIVLSVVAAASLAAVALFTSLLFNTNGASPTTILAAAAATAEEHDDDFSIGKNNNNNVNGHIMAASSSFLPQIVMVEFTPGGSCTDPQAAVARHLEAKGIAFRHRTATNTKLFCGASVEIMQPGVSAMEALKDLEGVIDIKPVSAVRRPIPVLPVRGQMNV